MTLHYEVKTQNRLRFECLGKEEAIRFARALATSEGATPDIFEVPCPTQDFRPARKSA